MHTTEQQWKSSCEADRESLVAAGHGNPHVQQLDEAVAAFLAKPTPKGASAVYEAVGRFSCDLARRLPAEALPAAPARRIDQFHAERRVLARLVAEHRASLEPEKLLPRLLATFGMLRRTMAALTIAWW